MKYIILDNCDFGTVLMFDDSYKHCEAAAPRCPVKSNDYGSDYGENYGEYPRVSGAGFVQIRANNEVGCYGESTSLYRDPSGTPTKSRGIEDARVIARVLGHNFTAIEI